MIINFIDGTGGSGSGYTLPIATSSVLGGVMIGSGITIDTAGTISADVAQDLSGLFAGVEYDSSATSINFYDREGTLVGQVDATDFVIDGMIEDVYITGSTLVIEFNTAAGKEDIEIDLTEIFNPNNYYTKSQVDAEITAATSPIQTQVDDMERVTATALTELHDSIIDLSGATEDMATQTWVQSQGYLTQHQSLDNYYTKSEVDAELSGVTEDMATETWVDEAIEAALSGVTSDVLQPVSDFPQDAPNGSVVAKPAESRKIYSWDIDTTEKVAVGPNATLVSNYDTWSTGQFFSNSDLIAAIKDWEIPNQLFYIGIMTWEEYNAAHPGTVSQDKYRQFPMEYESYWIDYTDPTYPRTDYKVSVYTDGSKVYVDAPGEGWKFTIVGHGSDPEQEYHTETTVFNKGSIYQNVDGTWENMLSGFTTAEDIEAALTGYTPDLSNYYTKSEVDADIATAMAAEVARTEGAYASKEDFDFISAKTQTNEQVLSAAVVELNDKFSGYTPTSGFATINGSAITTGDAIVIPAPDLSNYYTKSEVDAEITTAIATETARTESTYLKEHQSLANYYTKSEVDAEIASATTNFVTSGDVEDAITAATNDMATETWVGNQGYITGYTLSAATANDLGGIKVGDGLSMSNAGVLSTSVKIVKVTQAQYDAMEQAGTLDANTLYLI